MIPLFDFIAVVGWDRVALADTEMHPFESVIYFLP
jgi:hypothetical protein